MSNRTVQAAAEGMPASQLGTNYLRTDKASAAPAAAPAPRDFGQLESALSDAQMFAHLTVYVAERALPDDSGANSLVKTTTWERDLVLFAADQAWKAAGNALDELAAFLEAGR